MPVYRQRFTHPVFSKCYMANTVTNSGVGAGTADIVQSVIYLRDAGGCIQVCAFMKREIIITDSVYGRKRSTFGYSST